MLLQIKPTSAVGFRFIKQNQHIKMKIKNIDDFNIYKSFKVGERLEICRSCEFNSKIYYGENIGNINFKKNYKAGKNLNPLEHCLDCNCVIIYEDEGKVYGVNENCPRGKWEAMLEESELEELNVFFNSNNNKKCNTCKK